MAWQLTYFAGADAITRVVYGRVVAQATATPSGSSVALTVPSGAGVVRVKADSAGTINNAGRPASATDGLTLASSETVDLDCTAGLTLL